MNFFLKLARIVATRYNRTGSINRTIYFLTRHKQQTATLTIRIKIKIAEKQLKDKSRVEISALNKRR